MTISIRPLGFDDLDATEALLTAAYGRPDEWRLEVQRYLTLQPEGWLAAVMAGDIVGIGGAIDYGPFASIGLMATQPGMQRRGIATEILDRLVSWLRDRECPVAMLDGSASGAPVYERYGFLDDGTTVFYRRDEAAPPAAEAGRADPLQAADLPALREFDMPIFGADRSALLRVWLEANPGRAFLTRRANGSISGYAIAQPRRVGPWLAGNADDARALLNAALSVHFEMPPSVLMPSACLGAPDLLAEHGFSVQRALRHMYLGANPPPQNRSLIYGLASFATG